MFIGVSNFKNFEIYYIKYSKLQYLLAVTCLKFNPNLSIKTEPVLNEEDAAYGTQKKQNIHCKMYIYWLLIYMTSLVFVRISRLILGQCA